MPTPETATPQSSTSTFRPKDTVNIPIHLIERDINDPELIIKECADLEILKNLSGNPLFKDFLEQDKNFITTFEHELYD